MVSHNTTLVSSLGLRIGPACAAGLSAGMRRERGHPKGERKKKANELSMLTCHLANFSELHPNCILLQC